MFCNECGSMIPDGQAFCSQCGSPAPVPVEPQNGFVPIKQDKVVFIETPKEYIINQPAKLGMILGIVSIPTVYFLLLNIIPGVIGLILSIIGLKRVPELGGKRQAVTGIITSSIGISLFIFGMFILMVSMIKEYGY